MARRPSIERFFRPMRKLCTRVGFPLFEESAHDCPCPALDHYPLRRRNLLPREARFVAGHDREFGNRLPPVGFLERRIIHWGAVSAVRTLAGSVIDWMRWLANAKKNGPATVNGKRALAMAVWNDAADKGYCTFPPSSRSEKIPKRIEPERIPVTWSLAEIDRILAAASAVPGCWSGIPAGRLWVLAILMFWDTGCRLQEVLTARMDRIDLAAGTLLIPAENRKGRRRDRLYPLHSQTIAALRSTLPGAPGISGSRELVFSYPYCERTLQKHLSAILCSAGLPADRTRKFHCIRRSAESYAARERGVQWAANAVGHNIAVARKSYVSPLIAPGPTLIDALPRPSLPAPRRIAASFVLTFFAAKGHKERKRAAFALSVPFRGETCCFPSCAAGQRGSGRRSLGRARRSCGPPRSFIFRGGEAK